MVKILVKKFFVVTQVIAAFSRLQLTFKIVINGKWDFKVWVVLRALVSKKKGISFTKPD